MSPVAEKKNAEQQKALSRELGNAPPPPPLDPIRFFLALLSSPLDTAVQRNAVSPYYIRCKQEYCGRKVLRDEN